MKLTSLALGNVSMQLSQSKPKKHETEEADEDELEGLLPITLKNSLNNMQKADASLKSKFDNIKRKFTKYGVGRPPGSYKDPILSDIHSTLNFNPNPRLYESYDLSK